MEHQEEEEVVKKSYCRFKYKVEDLKKAIEEVKARKMSINKASQVYSIPKGTLVNKLKSDVPFLRKMGPPSVLSQEEENRLKDWILDKAKLGFPMHEEDLKDTVQKVLNDSKRTTIFNNNRPGKKWVELFLKRHPEISKRNTEVISKAKAAVTDTKLREWFDKLTCYLHEENAVDVLQDPKIVYPFNPENVDFSRFISTRREQLGKVHKCIENTSVAEYKIALKVVESVIGKDSTDLFRQIYNRDEEPEDVELKSIFLIWRKIKEVASEEVFWPSKQTNAAIKEREETEQFQPDENDLVPISKQGCSTTTIPGCSQGIHKEDFPHKTTEDAPTQKNKTVLSVSNPVLGESSSPNSYPWDKHLYWLKKEEVQTKKRKQEKVPNAMTSKNWNLYHDGKQTKYKRRKGECSKNEED